MAVVSPHCAAKAPLLLLHPRRNHNHNRILRLNKGNSWYWSFSLSSITNTNTNINKLQLHHHHHHHQRLIPSALDSDVPKSVELEQWDSLTAKFSGASNIPFLLLQLPQIILNARNLLAANKSALLAVPWLGMLTGLLGNLSLLSYFAKKREKEVIVVQTLGVLSQYVVFAQLAMADAMPLPYFLITTVVVLTGLLLNFLNYFYLLNASLWRFWEDFITIGGLSALPQVGIRKTLFLFTSSSTLLSMSMLNKISSHLISTLGYVVHFCSLLTKHYLPRGFSFSCSCCCCYYGKPFLFDLLMP